MVVLHPHLGTACCGGCNLPLIIQDAVLCILQQGTPVTQEVCMLLHLAEVFYGLN